MKATGIVRRIDDLGRVVIPKEIRRTMGIIEGDPLEISIDTETNSVCFRKYHADAVTAHIDDLMRVIRYKCYDESEVNTLCSELEKIKESISKSQNFV